MSDWPRVKQQYFEKIFIFTKKYVKIKMCSGGNGHARLQRTEAEPGREGDGEGSRVGLNQGQVGCWIQA